MPLRNIRRAVRILKGKISGQVSRGHLTRIEDNSGKRVRLGQTAKIPGWLWWLSFHHHLLPQSAGIARQRDDEKTQTIQEGAD